MKIKIIIAFVVCFYSYLFACCQQVAKTKNIQSAFNPKHTEWDISWPGRISQYDLVYKSPPIDPMQGIPLGNGDIGGLFWCEGSKIIIVLNKCDLWDDAKPDSLNSWKNETYDHFTTLRHASRIIIDFKFPVFSALYLTDFDARLNLANASLNLEATSPFGKVGIKAFIDHKSGILLCELESDFAENVPVDISVERFGSRTYAYWYSAVNRDSSIGLSGTEIISDKDGVYLKQELSSGSFAVGAKVLNGSGLVVDYSRGHSHRGLIQLSGSQKKKAQLAFAVTSPISDDPVLKAKNILSAAVHKGIESFLQSHSEVWKSIWNRSFMDYGDDYLNNLWYLTMYYANSSQGGKYPGRFNNGLWSWSHDVQNWNFYFNWNQQQLYWPLNAAGFHELVTPYLDYRYNSLPHAQKDAKSFFHSEGAFISDVTNRNGYNSMAQAENHTPVAEIALDFWRQYQYTGDKQFLKEKALPFILEAAKFFESLLIKENDGLYHAKEGTGYEGWVKFKDGLTELVYARALFTSALKALKATNTKVADTEKWNDILENMAPLPVIKPSEGLIVKEGKECKVNWGIFKGYSVLSDKVVAAGWGIKQNKWLTTYFSSDDPEYSFFTKDYPGYSAQSKRNELKLFDGIFPTVPSAPVFPSGLIGLAQRGDSLFDIMTTTTLLYGAEATGWDPVSIVMARLGLPDALAVDLDNFPSRWQIYCNGWGHWGIEGEINKDAEWYFRTNQVHDISNNEKFPLRMWPFRHMSMESMSVLATAMNESLLQSYDGTLRVFPAFPSDKNGRFTLHAEGGFIVSSEIRSGEVQWICIKSLFGNPCKLALPWGKATLQSNMKKVFGKIAGTITEINTKAGEVLMVLPEEKTLNDWQVSKESPETNQDVKYHSSGKTQLGLPRMF